MGNFGGEGYSGVGAYVGPAYVERGTDGSVSIGLSAGVSPPTPGYYSEAGVYSEHTTEKDGSNSFGSGTYVESGVSVGNGAGVYTCTGRCWDNRK